MKKGILLSIFAISLLAILTSGTTDDNGKAGYTNSPGESNCTVGCHSTFALNSGSGSVSVTSNIPSWEYTPGQSYSISLTVAHTGRSLFGLGFEALTSTNANAGTLTAGTGSQIKTKTVSGVSRRNIVHQLGGGSGTTDSHTFTFSWLAPTAGTGNVTFYYAGVAADGSNGNKQDYVYTGSQVVTEFVAPSGVHELVNGVNDVRIYPNPVKNEFILNYSLAENARVESGIYSLTGQLVQVISNDNQTKGHQSELVNLNENIGTGVYILYIRAGETTRTQKIIVQ